MIESQIESLNFIGGEWVPADSGETSELVNPSNPSEVLGTTPKSGVEETGRAIEAAAVALPGWKATLPAARGEAFAGPGSPRTRSPRAPSRCSPSPCRSAVSDWGCWSCTGGQQGR